mmetsp:Transcript_17348/g.43171  ORF Transcript_17348/g.43171 Transcript_17348/m.43171 type:complete len:176 (-) Transcript_17348:41-568(-)
MYQQQKAVTSREIFLRIALGSPCSGEDEYNAEISRCWPALNALFLDSKAPIYNRVKNIVRLEVDAIYEPAIPGGHQGTVVFDVLLELGNLNPKAPADVAKPLLQRELKRLCAPDALVRVKRVVPAEHSGWHMRTAVDGGFAGDMAQRLVLAGPVELFEDNPTFDGRRSYAIQSMV